MRVISQDGTIDIPYDKVVIQRFKSEIYFLNKNLTGVEGVVEDMRIAEYSSKEKAIKAMEMLHEMYKKILGVEGGFDYTTNHYVQPNYWVLPKIFQFPKDDEVNA